MLPPWEPGRWACSPSAAAVGTDAASWPPGLAEEPFGPDEVPLLQPAIGARASAANTRAKPRYLRDIRNSLQLPGAFLASGSVLEDGTARPPGRMWLAPPARGR